MTSQLNQLLDQVKKTPGNGRLLSELARWYAAGPTPPADRALIRSVLASEPALLTVMHRWGAAVPTDDPQRYVRLRLLVHAMTDARPDAYEAGLQIEEVIKWAHRQGIDAAPHLEAVKKIASPAVANIFEQRWLAWQRARRFVDEQIASLLATLQQTSSDQAALGSLVVMYTHPDTTEDQRRAIRSTVQSRPSLLDSVNRWLPGGQRDDPQRFLRLALGAISMTDARPDRQQAARRVADLRVFAQKNGFDAQPHIDSIRAISSPAARDVLR